MIVDRLSDRIGQNAAPADASAVLADLAAQLKRNRAPTVRWIRAQSGNTLHLISVTDIDYLRSDSKYTRIAWREPSGELREALVRTALKELAEQLPDDRFARIHRSVIVNLGAIRHVRRGDNETAVAHLHDREETLPVSRSYVYLFRDP